MNTSLNNPDAGKNRVNKNYNTKSNYPQHDNIPAVIMEEDEIDVENNISVSNVSNLFQSKILDMSIVNRSQQRLSPIHINNRKYPIIDYIGTNNNNNKLTDRSLIIGSPTKKLSIIEKSKIPEDYKGPLLNIFQKSNLNYFDELPEFFEKNNNNYLVPVDFYKRNSNIKLFINQSDLDNISQETVYNSLYTKTPLLEIDRFIINELNSKLEMSYNNFQKILNDYNNVENIDKLPYLLKKFESGKYQDKMSTDKLIKLMNIIKDNCDLESEKIWLNWRIQQLDGICLVLRDNLKMVEEQQRELNYFKNKLEMISFELIKLRKLSILKKDKITFVNKGNKKDALEKYENEKWNLKRSILIKKYGVDIGTRDDIKDLTKRQSLVEQLKECFNRPESNSKEYTSFEQKTKKKILAEDKLIDVHFLSHKHKVISKREKLQEDGKPIITIELDFKYLPHYVIQIDTSGEEILQILAIEKTNVYINDDKSKLWKLLETENNIDIEADVRDKDTITSKIDFLKETMDLYKRLEDGYEILNRLLNLKINDDHFKGNVTFNRFNGKILFKISFTKFKMVILDKYNLLRDLSLEAVNEEDYEYVKINFINSDIGIKGLWKDEMPLFFKDILGWSI